VSRLSVRSAGLALAVLVAGACTTQTVADANTATTATGVSDSAMVVEAVAFMESYARDLVAGNRTGIAERYDRRGAWLVGHGKAKKESYDSIAAQYAGASWQPPATFVWKDLAYEPQGPNAIMVVGRFEWGGAPGAPPMVMSYSGLLQRQDGQWRIHLEDESADPLVLAKLMATMDTTGAKARQP
jgi:hypothetical protein